MIRRSTPHSPLGAGASFDFGPAGEPAGFSLHPAATPAQNVYVGCRPGPREPWRLLPFFTPVAGGPAPLPKGRYGRFLAWAGDKWMIGPLVFKLCTPFSPAADPADDAFRHAPAVCGYLEYDNTPGADPAELIFGVGGAGQTIRDDTVAGFLFEGTHGFGTSRTAGAGLRRDAGLFGAEIGAAAALHFTVPPHEKRRHPLVLGFYQPGRYYTRHFPDLSAVLNFGLAAHDRSVALADACDAEFMRSALAFDAKTRAAHDVRAWLGQTRRLLADPEIDLAPLRELCRTVTGQGR